MISEQITPSVTVQATNNSLLSNFTLKDETCLIAFNKTINNSTISMTKQLTTTISATTISNSTLAPTNVSPTNSLSFVVSPTNKGACIVQKDGIPSAISGNNFSTTTIPIASNLIGGSQKKQSASSSSNDASGRSAALERAYVHDVYENCEEPSGPVRPRVAQFLSNLDPGSVVCDVGCGSGRYLTQCNPGICTIGVDRCYRLSKVAKKKGGEVALCDNLELPFRDESFDAVLSLAVVHHFATTERRVNALRELARILRIGGRVVITVWALEQHHRRFESQDVLIPWQPPKNRNFSCSDEEDDDNFLPPYHAYIEDSTNSSRSAGDGDSSSLSSSSPGESCYSFVRRAIQKLAGGRKHPWFLDSWTSKETKNDSSLDYEDAKDLPIELRRLEDFEDFSEPPLATSLKSRSLGSILNPPPRQIVRSRSSVPSLGGPLLQTETSCPKTQTHNAQFYSISDGNQHSNTVASTGVGSATTNGHVTTNVTTKNNNASFGVGLNGNNGVSSTMSRRPKLIKQKQSLCDEDYQLPENSFHIISNYNSNSHIFNNSLLYMKSGCYHGSITGTHLHQSPESTTQANSIFLRKQSSLNEELMAGNRIREKERLRKRIQKQMSLNEAFLCRSALLSKRLQVIREGFTSKMKNSTNSLERATKNGFSKIMQNFKTTPSTSSDTPPPTDSTQTGTGVDNVMQLTAKSQCQHQHQHHHHHHHYAHQQQQQQHNNSATTTGFRAHLPHILRKQSSTLSAEHVANKFGGPVIYCNGAECVSGSSACYCSTYHHGCSNCSGTTDGSNGTENADTESRRHSRESGSDSSKDSSLQSDTSIESEDSFASVIFIPKPEQHQQQLNYQQQHQNSNSSSSNSSSSNGGVCHIYNSACCSFKGCAQQSPHQQQLCKGNCSHSLSSGHQSHNGCHQQRIPSLPTSPLIMPCPPTPAHSPAAAQTAVTSPPQTMAAVTAAMAILTPASTTVTGEHMEGGLKAEVNNKSRFSFDEAHIKQHENKNQGVLEQVQPVEQSKKPKSPPVEQPKKPNENLQTSEPVVPPPVTKITRQVVNDLPPIPKFRKQQSLQLQRQNFPIVRRSSGSGSAVPSIPKLLSLEIFNPATDDLDSDSSEPSSPDSIDSVISAPKSATINAASIEEHSKEDVVNAVDGLVQFNENDEEVKLKQINKESQHVPHNIINEDECSLLVGHSSPGNKETQNCSEFAEQLNAQLLREIEDKNNRVDCYSLDNIGDIGEYLEDPFSGSKKRNGEQRDLIALRDELRERRLMLANLSTQPSLQQSPTSSSTSSLSSQTRSFTIHEEDEEEDEEENERSYTLQLYENCKISKFNYKRNRHYNLNAETAYLLQDDGDSSAREEDELEDYDHDVILEEDEDEEAVAAAERNSEQSVTIVNHKIKDRSMNNESRKTQNGKAKTCSHATEQKRNKEGSLENRHSTESCEHSNSSTTSLDSPSQGGSTTHHRYYHVFREGELDALINHHVASLHIVSSYYERASWCVVAEKVQVWTI